ncbi:MAG: NUDIX domain-containing protein [Candidatus Moranbacteria bacterium]|nr:NUDIX domain-containing protein [bacterium]MDP1833329.1 NUDIX domain-containing protein [Candidatus Moranbacteria bacterium]
MDNKFQPIVGVAIIIENKTGKFLLHLRDENAPRMKNQWCLLGGCIESGFAETPEQAAAREIAEETGIVVKPENLRFFKKIILQDGVRQSHIYHIRLDLDDKDIKVGEGKEFRFFPKAGLPAMLGKLGYTNSFLEVLAEFMRNGTRKI